MNIRGTTTRRRPLGGGGTENAPRRHKPDYLLVLLSVALLAVGFVVVYAISPSIAATRGVSEQYLITKQITAIVLGVISFFSMSLVPVQWWRKMSKPLLILAILLTLGALITPVNAEYPAHRWVRFAGLSFQTAEYVKLALIIWAASFFAVRASSGELTSTPKTFKPTLYVLGAIGFVIAGLQSDLGSAAVMLAIIVMIAYIAGMPISKFLPLGAMVIGLATLIILASFVVPSLQYRVSRLHTFLNPASDCQNAGYQSCQALIAIGSGGMFGKGVGKSVEASGYLPEAANDSIFAIMVEKFGFFGITIIVGIYVALFGRLKRLIDRAPSMYTRLMITGILAWFSMQAIINIGAMVGLLPLKGITLPFVSYGGTSLLFVTAALGLAFQVSRYSTYTSSADEIPSPQAVDEDARRQTRPFIVRRRTL